MNYNEQCKEWMAKHPNATIEEAWKAGYMQCTDNWCKGER